MVSNPPSQEAEASSRVAQRELATGPFVLRTLLHDVPLSEDGDNDDVRINCVDYLGGNLYIGTSASELLHFVQIPPDPADRSGQPVFILASRLRPTYNESSVAGNTKPGVQQILLLSRVQKACVLCNNTVTFYSLPELSPVFGTVRVKNCYWIGGLDLDQLGGDNDGYNDQRPVGETIMLSLSRKIQVVRVGDDARVFKQIDFAGSTISVRRDSIACVADSRNYALLDVDRQLKIPLMSISSLDHSQPNIGQAQNIAGNSDVGILRSVSSVHNRPSSSGLHEGQGHSRSTSLGGIMSQAIRRQGTGSADGYDSDYQGSDTPQRSGSPDKRNSQEYGSTDKPLPSPPVGASQTPRLTPAPRTGPVILKPLIVSPTPEEFLIVTGTGPQDPGIGMFVNLDGDPTRPTMEFDRYPREIVVDGGGFDMSTSRPSLGDEEEGYVLASMTKELQDGPRTGLEIQRWDVNVGGGEVTKYWLEAPVKTSEDPTEIKSPISLGIRSLMGADESNLPEVVDKLCLKRFSPFSSGQLGASTMSLRTVDSRTALSIERLTKERELFERDDESPLPDGWEATRNAEEEDFARRFAKTTTRLAVWSDNRIWWAVRNPLLLQLDASIACTAMEARGPPHTVEDRRELFSILSSIKGRDAKTELEFMTFNYIKQRASVLLFTSFLHSKETPFPPELKAMEEVLLDSNLDPRVVIGLVPGLQNEIIETKKGIWIFGGVKETIERYMASDKFGQVGQTVDDLGESVLLFIKSYLWATGRKKGMASTANEGEIFRTVDAALLVALLKLDKNSPKGLAKTGSVRSELYELVDKGVDCFDRAVDLLESYHRLFVLSRLYQSRKMSAEVLATWKRIIEGEQDDGGELRDGELRVREYLSKISSQSLVQEYGIWLANRNPKLGVQVFADDKGRAPKFEPAQVVAILREEAPDAVKYYLEHLVFGKGYTKYVNELITYYLDIVIRELQSSAEAREAMAATYVAYRALRPPKPTYRQFLHDNAPPEDELWHSRLRLLQLLGETHDYDFKAIRARISEALPADKAEEQLLVPETIILDGRERRHEEALRLLVHRLGDYDTAVSYCLRGGASIYTPQPGRRESMPTEDTQAGLFRTLLREFLAIEDVSDRLEQTGALLERFGGWFDVMEVLEQVPDEWSVDVVAGFLATALRRLVAEKHEAEVKSKLSSAENLRVNWELIAKVDEKGPTVETGG
ncbi:Transforming growth factor-beta receptor-associated protein 1 [Cytospora mali]|uniref:Transforming growth factor-beta receptor-associated protein 1 n=1 Tax=Cytospora mali TaxID=578113 RepID=A0A194W5F6_CYTMA|nr:Transforming growth factor-beta receptor-associated protein 1 [Valsa mali]